MPFERNDTAYRQWLARHPNGFILNYGIARPDPTYLVLHRADCRTIQARPPRQWTYIYGKFCRDQRGTIERWAHVRQHGDARPCAHCERRGRL